MVDNGSFNEIQDNITITLVLKWVEYKLIVILKFFSGVIIANAIFVSCSNFHMLNPLINLNFHHVFKNGSNLEVSSIFVVIIVFFLCFSI